MTVNIDSNTVDGPVVGPGSVPAPAPAPPPPPQPTGGSVTTSDGLATVSWPAGAFTGTPTVTATPSKLASAVGGFAAGSYVVTVTAAYPDATQVTRFAAPVKITFLPPVPTVVPAFAPDGLAWKPLRAAAFTRAADGTLTISTTSPGSFGLLRDIAAPTRPTGLTGRFVHGRLVLGWRAATDNSRSLAGYEITLNGKLLAAASATRPSASVLAFYPDGPSVFRVSARDASGNASSGSAPVVVRPAKRPAAVPHEIPNWAFQLFAWQQAGRAGKRPVAPLHIPGWYWSWASWRLHPFRVV